jgi:hypothetical protein
MDKVIISFVSTERLEEKVYVELTIQLIDSYNLEID